MKLFKNTKAFLAAALLVAGLCLTTSCSSPASDKTDDGGSGSGGLNNYSSSGSIDDGNAIAYYLCESLCSSSKESVKLCFYGDNTFKIRQTSLDDDDYGQRYDYMLGTYEGDPTKDGSIIINFTKIREFEFIYTGDPSDLDNIDSLEDFSKLDQSKISGGYRYKDISKDFEPDIDVKIKDGQFTLSNLNYSGNLNGFYHSSLSFTKTDAKDRGPYQYTGVSRRANDPRRTEWTIPEGYTSIADGGFSSSDNKLKLLKKITLPSTIKKIGYSAFYNLTGLEEINIPETCTEIGSSAFYNCTSLKTITIPKNIKTISSSAFSKSSSYSSDDDDEEKKEPILVLRFADGTTTIPDDCCYGFTLVKSIVLPSSVKVIGKRAFKGLDIVTQIQIPEGVEEIGDYALYNSSSSEQDVIEELTLPSTVKKIGECAFEYWKIKKLVLPEGLEEVGNYAFYNYNYSSDTEENLSEVVLPSTLKKLGYNVFSYSYINKITSNASLRDLSNLFQNISLRYSTTQVYCGNVDVTQFFKGNVISDLVDQWEEEGMWFTKTKNSYSTDGVITFYSDAGKSKNYDFAYGSQYDSNLGNYVEKFKLEDFAIFRKVNTFSVIEKQETTADKWCEKAEKDSSGKYIIYQYYLEKAGDNDYLDYINTPVYYRDDNYEYQNKYYKSCKEEIENMLNNHKSSYYVNNYETSETDYFVHVYSDPQQQQEED